MPIKNVKTNIKIFQESEIKIFLEIKPERVFQGQIFNKDRSRR